MLPAGLVRLLVVLMLASLSAACATAPSGLDPLNRATVLIEHAKGHGTGTIVGPRAVLTAYHVVEDDSIPLAVTFFDGPTRTGRMTWYDEALDLALVEVDVPAGYPVPKLTCAAPQTGQQLVALGHPTQSRWVAVAGRLPSTNRVGRAGLMAMGFPIGLGTSGGPVFDEGGRVIGVSMAILAERTSTTAAGAAGYKDTGIGLMLPVRDFCDLARNYD